MEVYKLVFSPIEVNTYILADPSGDCAVIDCGCFDMTEFRTLKELIDEKKLNPVLLLNTHCHLDHIFGNRFMYDKYSLRTYCHRDEEYNRKNAVSMASYFGLTMEEPPEPAGYLQDGQKIAFGASGLEILHVPGHSEGSIAFYSAQDGVVFTGDALFAGSIGRTDLHGGNYKTLISSIKAKLFTLPHDTVVYPGHGEKTSIGLEINSNPYFNLY